MKMFFVIIKQDLLLSLRNSSRILANFLFFIISMAIFSMMLQGAPSLNSSPFYISIIIWFLLISCLIFSASEFLKQDFDDGTLEQMLIICANFEIFILAKYFSNWLIYALPILCAIPLVALFSSLNHEIMLHFLALALLASLAINCICSFCGSLALLGNSAPMIAIIALPLIIPILLIANNGLQEASFYISCKLLGGLTILFGSIAVLAGAKIIKIALE